MSVSNPSQDLKYKVVDNKLVLMTIDDEYQWLYNLIVTEIKKVAKNKEIETINPRYQNINLESFDTTAKQLDLTSLELIQTLVTIATALGIDCEELENNPRYFHLTDKNGDARGFDLLYFESRNQKLLNSFANIIFQNFDCGLNPVVPIFLPSYPESILGDGIILVSKLPGLSCYAEIMDYAHPNYIKMMQKFKPN